MTYSLKRKVSKKGNNFTTFGNLTFKDSVVSGFSSANYIKTIPAQFTSQTANASNWEMVFKVTYKAGSEYQNIWCQSGSYATKLTILASGKLELALGNSGTSIDIGNIIGTTTLIENTAYWVKAEFTGSAYKLYLSVNGIDFTLEGSLNSTTKIIDRGSNAIGVNIADGSNYKQFLGSIDLSECYININGERWWSPFFDYYEPKNYLLRKFGEKKYYKYSTQQVGWTQPKLTSNNMAVTGGNIVCTASSNYGKNTDIYKIMLGSVSSTVDKDYWQVNGSTSAQWVQIKFPYKLRITGLSVYTRPRDNFTRTVRAYTSSSKTTQIGSAINTSAGGAKYTFLSNGSGIDTDTIYLAIDAGNSDNAYYGLQNLQITATTGRQIVVDGTSSDYSFSVDEKKPYFLMVNPDNQTKTYYTFTINPTPTNAIVTINGETTNSIELAESSIVDWSVSLDGYKTQTGSLSLNQDKTIDVILEEEEQPQGDIIYYCYEADNWEDQNPNYPPDISWGGDMARYYYVNPKNKELSYNAINYRELAESSADLKTYDIVDSFDEETFSLDFGLQDIHGTRYRAGDLYT